MAEGALRMGRRAGLPAVLLAAVVTVLGCTSPARSAGVPGPHLDLKAALHFAPNVARIPLALQSYEYTAGDGQTVNVSFGVDAASIATSAACGVFSEVLEIRDTRLSRAIAAAEPEVRSRFARQIDLPEASLKTRLTASAQHERDILLEVAVQTYEQSEDRAAVRMAWTAYCVPTSELLVRIERDAEARVEEAAPTSATLEQHTVAAEQLCERALVDCTAQLAAAVYPQLRDWAPTYKRP
jgi:hypothetical protein